MPEIFLCNTTLVRYQEQVIFAEMKPKAFYMTFWKKKEKDRERKE